MHIQYATYSDRNNKFILLSGVCFRELDLVLILILRASRTNSSNLGFDNKDFGI